MIISGFEIVKRWNGLARDYQDVSRSDRIDVSKGEADVIFVYHVGGEFTICDLLK